MPSWVPLKDSVGWALWCSLVVLGYQKLVVANVGSSAGRQGAAHCPTPAVVLPVTHSRATNSAAPPTQVELASILKFVLDNEECLNENLEPFLQGKGMCWALTFPPVCAAVAIKAAAPPRCPQLQNSAL